MTDALLRQWTLLKLIPRAPRTADVGQLLSGLNDAGHTITRRQLQRDLNTLSTLFPISADDRSIPYGCGPRAPEGPLRLDAARHEVVQGAGGHGAGAGMVRL